MEPLSIAASVVGVVAPALQTVRRLLDDIHNITDAPDTITLLRNDLDAVDKALTSLQAVSDAQWQSLGETVVEESKAAMTLCLVSGDRFRSMLARWTRHSNGGRLSWKDRANVGFFKQSQIKSMSDQLQSCKITLASVVSIATL
jgi:hypothetical protein